MRKYIVDSLLILAATVPVVLSFAIDLEANDLNLFQRSGSIMVLFAVVLEYRQLKCCEIEDSRNVYANGKPISTGGEMPKCRRFLQSMAIVLAILGTAVWGYGDLLVNWVILL